MAPDPTALEPKAEAAWPIFWDALALGGGYNTSLALISVALLGLASGLIGAFAMLRGRTLVADAIAHAALPGVALAFIAATALAADGKDLGALLFGATLAGLLGAGCIHALARWTRLGEDSAIAAVLSVFFGFGVVLLSHIQNAASGDQAGVAVFIYGQAATVSAEDAALIGAIALACALLVALFFKELVLLCFDRGYGAVAGLPVAWADLLLATLLVAVTMAGLKAVGALLVIAMIATPAAAARFWSERAGPMTALSGAIGAIGAYVGAALSAALPNAPAGGVIVLTVGAIFAFSLLFAPARGVLPAALRSARSIAEIAAHHALRAAFEAIETGASDRSGAISIAALLRRRPGLRPTFAIARRWLLWRGLADFEGDRMRLTSAGRREALRVTRNHRLWERFLVAYADLAPSHVDHSADLVEHVLPAETVAELERELESDGRLPRHVGAPPSIHPIEHDAPGPA